MCFISGLNLCETNVAVMSVFRPQGALQAAARRGESVTLIGVNLTMSGVGGLSRA